jgi:hypothetical protein
MKNPFKEIFFIISVMLFFSCKKDDLAPQQTNIYNTTTIIYNNNPVKEYFYNNPTFKLWAHEMDTKEDAKEALQQFPGIELNIRYKGTYFDVGKTLTRLSLDEYMASIENPQFYYFWLDFKNLTEENAEESYKLLMQRLQKYNITNNAIIESSNAEALGYYASNNLFTSYWIPWVNDPTADNNNGVAAEINYYLKKYPFSVISSDYRLYPFIQKYFPAQDTHLWVKNSDVATVEEAKSIAADLSSDPFVKAILITTDNYY